MPLSKLLTRERKEGFAAVADEIKNLAKDSEDATAKISLLTTAIAFEHCRDCQPCWNRQCPKRG